MSRVNEGIVFEAMQVVEDAQREALRFDNVGPAEVVSTMRRKLRDVLDRAYKDGWDAGYAAALMDQAAGREAERQAARDAAADQP